MDFLSNIGGVQGLLLSFFSVIVSFFNYQNFDNIMAAQFYKLKGNRREDKASFFIPTKYSNIIDYFIDLLPNSMIICCCKKKSRR